MLVNALMNTAVITASPELSIPKAVRLMAHYDVGALPVTSKDGRLRGMLTDRDITLRCINSDGEPEAMTVGEVMSRRVTSISPDADVREAASLMARRRVRRLPVVRDDKLVGIISLADIARARSCDMEASLALAKISAPGHGEQE